MEQTVSMNQDRDFRRVYRQGKTQVHSVLVTYALKNKKGQCRIGLTASKKMGKAFERNRARRVMRAAYRQLEPLVPSGWDFIFVARSRTAQVKTQQVLAVMKKQIEALTGKSLQLPASSVSEELKAERKEE